MLRTLNHLAHVSTKCAAGDVVPPSVRVVKLCAVFMAVIVVRLIGVPVSVSNQRTVIPAEFSLSLQQKQAGIGRIW